MKTNAKICLLLLAMNGCKAPDHRIYVGTHSVVGISIAQNPSTQMYEAKMGYSRLEIASLPSNRASGAANDTTTGSGASDTPDVLMELRYGNVFSLTEASIYQRLAVGSIAVSQPGAALMFAKDKSGTLDTATAEAVTRNIKTIPTIDPSVMNQLYPLAQAYSKATDKSKFDAIAVANGFRSFSDFLTSKDTSAEKVKTVSDLLKQSNLVP